MVHLLFYLTIYIFRVRSAISFSYCLTVQIFCKQLTTDLYTFKADTSCFAEKILKGNTDKLRSSFINCIFQAQIKALCHVLASKEN